MSSRINISVALAAYNGAEYIAGQIKSLLDQTLPPDEIIVSDDSRDEKTFNALPRDPRIHYIKNSNRPGVAGNFENAIAHCRGEYIFLCDQDDVWEADKIQKMAAALANDPALDGVFCNSALVNENLEPLNKTLWNLRRFTPDMQKRIAAGEVLQVFLKRVTLSSHNIAFKRRMLEKLLPFPELSPFYPDTFIALLIAAAGKWQALPETLTLYRIHSSNESAPVQGAVASAKKARKLRAAYRNAELANVIINRCRDITPEKLSMLKNFARHHARRDNFSANILLRSIQVLNELLCLRYKRYSDSLRTAIADMIIRPEK